MEKVYGHEQRLERLYKNLPKGFRNADVQQDYQLKRYLDILASGGFTPLHIETQGILDLIDFERIPAKFLPELASDLGFIFPYNLDEQTQRTYIKNAVLSYKVKGTKKALEFMLRELTRFKVNVVPDETDKKLEVKIEVDLDRHDFSMYEQQIDYIIRDYTPPFRDYKLTNTFYWWEQWDNKNFPDPDGMITVSYGYYELQEPYSFVTNIGLTNDPTKLLTNPFDNVYEREDIVLEDTSNILTFDKPDEDALNIKRLDLFFTNDSLLNNENPYIITSMLDQSDEPSLTFDLETETNNRIIGELEESLLSAPMNDFGHEDWFVTGRALTNDSRLWGGEGYAKENIRMEYDTFSIIIVDEDKFDSSYMKINKRTFNTNDGLLVENGQVLFFEEHDRVFEK